MLRSNAERVKQTLVFEAGGLLIATPLYAAFAGTEATESFVTVALISLVVMIWSPIHNTLFDLVELRRTSRLASDRPHSVRLVHAVSHELTSVLFSLPVLIWVGGFGFWQALIADVGLTILYTVYAYVFHLIFDRLRPIKAVALAQEDSI